ncbi:MAG: hypothetical protein GY842_21495 [bacterium]|nr:hypothetical protein [bacterium]
MPDHPAQPGPPVELSADQRMLLDIRDTLYEGSWEDFIHDLQARLDGSPHVYSIVPDAPGFADTIREHLRIIDRLWACEKATGRTLHSRPQ